MKRQEKDIHGRLHRLWRKLRLLRREDKAGIYITVIFHLTVIIVLSIAQISTIVSQKESFLFDFSRQEEIEAKEQEELFKKDISRQLDELISAAASMEIPAEEVRNVAVDGSMEAESEEPDEASTEQLLEDALSDMEIENAVDETVELEAPQKKQEENRQQYKGPSVVKWTLVGRKAVNLRIPAYRCMGGGEVTVVFTVNRNGIVTNAKVLEHQSSEDGCLREFAVRAAKSSRFSRKDDAPASQTGQITYRFIAQ